MHYPSATSSVIHTTTFITIGNVLTHTVHEAQPDYFRHLQTTMMRVEINMDESVRGLVSKYANETDKTMPEAYRELIIYGLLVSEVDFPTFSPNVAINDDAIEIATMDEENYELTIGDE